MLKPIYTYFTGIEFDALYQAANLGTEYSAKPQPEVATPVNVSSKSATPCKNTKEIFNQL